MEDFSIHCTVESNCSQVIVYKNSSLDDSEKITYWLTIKDIVNIILKHHQPNAIRTANKKIMIPLSSAFYVFSKMEVEDFMISFVINTIEKTCTHDK